MKDGTEDPAAVGFRSVPPAKPLEGTIPIKSHGLETKAPERVHAPPRGRPFGRIRVPLSSVDTAWRSLLGLFAPMLVVRTAVMYELFCIEFVVLCDAFELVETGKEPPLYDWFPEKHGEQEGFGFRLHTEPAD